jgi:UDP-2,3-diacylglucosamine hydrolase
MASKEVIYFVSDFHLGTDGSMGSKERERKIVRFLDFIAEDATTIYLLGDVFDYWFEYKSVVPKGYVRLFGKLAELSDSGIIIEFFRGNHDMWMFRYFQEELNILIHKDVLYIEHSGKKFIIGHGDGLGPGDNGYKFIKKVFSNPLLQRMYGSIHPNIGLRIMRKFSKKSRETNDDENQFFGPEREWLIQYAEEQIKIEAQDFFVFGHRHLPIDYTLSNEKSRYINLGDWLHHYSYGRFDGNQLKLLFFENENGKIYS